jgi:hypothetical protein
MKKIYLILISLFAIALVGNAQTVIFSSSFETWSNGIPSGWKGARTNIASDSVSQISGGTQYGNNAIQLRNANTSHKRYSTQSKTVTATKQYTAKYWAKGNGDIRFGMYDNDLSNGDFGYTYSAYQTLNTSSWTEITQQVVCDTNNTAGEFFLSIRNTYGTGIQIDSIVISEATFTTPTLSIYQIQYTTASNGNSSYNGQLVKTGGIVTAFRNFGKGVDKGYYIQSGMGTYTGVWVADSVNSVSKGDSIVINGKVGEFFSRTQIEQLSSFSLIGQATAPAAVIIPLTSAKTEAYEGMLIKVLGVKATSTPTQFGEYTVSDGNTTVDVEGQISGFTADSVVLNGFYNITGVINYAYGIYSINPRTDFDIEKTTGLKSTSILATNLYPNPANTYTNLKFEKIINGTIEIINALGSIVYNQEFNTDQITINSSEFTKGVYFIKINSNNNSEIKRLIIE